MALSNTLRRVLWTCGACGALLMSHVAAAQSVEQFYRGRTITMLVGSAPGGINDISARLVARHLGRRADSGRIHS